MARGLVDPGTRSGPAHGSARRVGPHLSLRAHGAARRGILPAVSILTLTVSGSTDDKRSEPTRMAADTVALPEGTVTVLSTDLVGSTLLNQRLGDAAATAVE